MEYRVIREILELINYWSPPLKKHRFRISCLNRKAYTPSGTPTGILVSEIRQKEASGIIDAKYAEPEDSRRAAGILEPPDPAKDAPPVEKAPEKRRLRSLKKLEKLIYDDTALKQGELEDEAFEMLNQDGFYDEVLPVDYYEGSDNTDKRPVKALLIYTGILFVLIGITLVVLKTVVF